MEPTLLNKENQQEKVREFTFDEDKQTKEEDIVQNRTAEILVQLHQTILVFSVLFIITYFIFADFQLISFIQYAIFSTSLLSISFYFALKDEAEISAILFSIEVFFAIQIYFLMFDVRFFDILYYGILPTIFLSYFVRRWISIVIISINAIILIVLGVIEGFELLILISYPGLFLILSSAVFLIIAKYQNNTQKLYEQSLNEKYRLQATIENQLETDNLTARLAHDFNNILNSISLNTEMVKMNINDTESIPQNNQTIDHLEAILKSIESGNELVKSLFRYQSEQYDEISTFNVINDIEKIMPILRALISTSTLLELDYPHNDIFLSMNKTEFNQMLINLVKNANEAIDGEGKITIRVRKNKSEGKRTCLISIEDTGTGMDEEIIDKLFTEQFTTKSYGNGIGLNSVMMIMKKHHGKILVKSEPNVGSTFTLILPCKE